MTHYDTTLDEKATPEQVAYVLLRALRDDALAATPESREAALNVQYDVSAAGILQSLAPTGTSPAELLYHVVSHWTPTVAHYVSNFDLGWEKAKTRLSATRPQPPKSGKIGGMECQVLMELSDPQGDPKASVVLAVGMAQDGGYWRVQALAFVPNRRTIKPRPAQADVPPIHAKPAES